MNRNHEMLTLPPTLRSGDEGVLALPDGIHLMLSDEFVGGRNRGAGRRQIRGEYQRLQRADHEFRRAPQDHPALMNLPETEYLKCLICQVDPE
jgi:23S rRNA G2069 N7-methylase RlmK/C1962 C5-methylase RlmI